MNLVSNADPAVVIQTHFVDSLSGLVPASIQPDARLLDIGTGAGFPGIPLKIYYPTLQVTVVDAVSKKIHFLRHLCRILQLQDVTCLAMRAEHLAVDSIQGQRLPPFDIIVSRAVGSLTYLAQLAAPLLAPQGCLLLYRGPRARQELAVHGAELRERGLQIRHVHEIQFTWLEYPRYLLDVCPAHQA